MKYLDDIKNNFDFFLRNKFIFSRKNYREKAQDLSDVFCSKEQEEIYKKLEEQYGSDLAQNTTKRIFFENIYFLEIFDKYLSKKEKDEISVLDIGSKNWSYVKSEYMFFNSFCADVMFNGIELDAYRLCSNLYTRYEISKFYTNGLKNTNYIVGDLMEHNEKYDYIIWILPFITEYPLQKWGLPLKYFKPKEMLEHAYNLLKEDGELLIINQGEAEYKIQQELINILNVNNYNCIGEISDKYNLFKNKRFATIITK